jgi:predicted nucleic acid-binding protein
MPPVPYPLILGANVLYSFLLRDTTLRAAEAEICQPYWSREILDELTRNLIAHRRISEEGSQLLREGMEKAFPEACITGYERWLPKLENDEKDRHVVAAALEAGVAIIVTANLDDFTPLPAGMQAVSPDGFLCELFERAPDIMFEVIEQQVADFKRPPVTHAGLLDHLAKQAPLFVAAIRSCQPSPYP